ncbi:MAG: SpoIIE family protein phosphatase [Phycicoccus sp.]
MSRPPEPPRAADPRPPALPGPTATAAGLTGLPQLTTRLLSATSLDEALEVIVDVGRPVVGADLACIVLREPDGRTMRMVASRLLPAWVDQEFSTYPVDLALPSQEAIRENRPVLLRTRAEQWRRFPYLEQLQLDVDALAALPLPDAGGPFGALVLGWQEEQAFADEHVELATSIAGCCAAALLQIDRQAELVGQRDAAVRSSAQLAELQALSGDLARATHVAEVADVIASTAAKSLGATAATLARYDHDTDTFTLLAVSGLPPEGWERWSTFPASASRLAVEQLRTRAPVLVTSHADRDARYPEMRDNQVSQQAWANLPLLLGARVVGITAFGWDDPRDFTTEEVDHLWALAAHAAVALDRAYLIEAASSTAETLQRALLPQAAPIPEWEVGTIYSPSVRGTQVGGDWYDVFALPSGLVGLALGDVAGKGIHAAATMGSVRSALRAFATADADPAVVLRELDVFVEQFSANTLVTCCYVVLDPETGALRYCNAGHLPPLVAESNGVRWLDEGVGPPLGVDSTLQRRAIDAELSTDSDGPVLLLYSDGLVESRSTPIDTGMSDLADAARLLVVARGLGEALVEMVDGLEHAAGRDDDRAVLAIRPAPGGRHPG